jgi:hypothetical protein
MIAEAVMTSMSHTTPEYRNGIFNFVIKSYNELPEKIKRLHSIILKKSWNQYFCKTVSVLGVVTKMPVAEKLEVWTFKIISYSANKAFCTNKAGFGQLLNWQQERRICITWFGQDIVPFASWEKSTGQRSWGRFVSWAVILTQSLSSSLNIDTSRFLASMFRNRKHQPRRRSWSSKENV